MSQQNIFSINWSSLPFDLITSIVLYLSPNDIRRLCLESESFDRRVCQDQNSIIWKLLFQRDISSRVPTNDIASQYFVIMDEITRMSLDWRLIYGAGKGYDEMVKRALDKGANVHVDKDYALYWAAKEGDTEMVRLLLDRGADIHGNNDDALITAALYGHPKTVKLLLDRGANIHADDDEALRSTTWNKDTETAKLLLDRGATITPEVISAAMMSGNPEIIALLK